MLRMKIALALVASLVALGSAADELAIEPGLWEFTWEQSNSMMGATQGKTERECIKERKRFDPAEMARGMQECTLLDSKRVGNELQFRMECMAQGKLTTMDGRLFTDGRTATSEMHFNLKAGPMEMKMNMKSTGKRIGDC